MYRLVVAYNEIEGKGLVTLAQCLNMNSSLSHLFIWGNHLEDAACIVNILISFFFSGSNNVNGYRVSEDEEEKTFIQHITFLISYRNKKIN